MSYFTLHIYEAFGGGIFLCEKPAPEEIPEILGVIAPMVSLSTSSDDGEYNIDVPVDESDEIFNRLTVHRLFKFLDDTEKE